MNISSNFIWLNLMLLWFGIMTVIFVLQIRDLIRMNKSIRALNDLHKAVSASLSLMLSLKTSEQKLAEAIDAKLQEDRDRNKKPL